MKLPASIFKRRITSWAAFLVATGSMAVFAASQLETMEQEVSAICEKSRDAVVKIHAQRQFQIGGLPFLPSQRVGTGFFIDKDGHILTAATVVEDADTCWIEWRGQKINARMIGRDPQTNLALLKIELEDGTGTPFLPQGNSDALHVGSMVIAFGFPYDLPSMPVVGFVGGWDIQSGGRVFATSHIRAGCRLSRGQGGGPVLNSRGEVIGVAVAAYMDDQCYVLPINAARKIAADILESGGPQYTWVGLVISERQLALNPTQASQTQVFVQQIYSNTPAASAGFRVGDVVVSITSNDVHRSADVLNAMFYHRVGDAVEFTVLRDGQEMKLLLTVGARPPQEAFGFQPVQQVAPARQPVQWPVMVPTSQQR
jgi:serine protease Do